MVNLEFLGSDPIVNGEDEGRVDIERIAGAGSFRIKGKRLIQFREYNPDTKGLKKLDDDVSVISVSYRSVYEGFRYNVKCQKD